MTRKTASKTGFKNKIVTVLAILLAVTATSYAFAHLKHNAIEHYHGMNGDHGKMLKEKLGLTDEQAEKVETIMADFKTKMKELHHNSEGDREAMHKEMMALKEQMNTEMKAVLTPEQFTKFEEMHRRHGRHGHGHGDHRNFDPEKMQGLHDEMKAYAQENIEPVLRPKRAELESVIADEDKAKIAEMRGKMKEKHERHREAKGGEGCEKACENRKGSEGNNTGHHRRGHGEHHGEMKALVEKYDAEMTKLLADLDDEKEKWHADMKAIAAKHLGEDVQKRHGGRMHHRGPMSKVHFLLMDPNATSETPAMDEPTIYPNPAETANNIELDVTKTGNVRIDVLDKDGNFIRTAENKSYEKGKHTIAVNIDDLEPGIYIFQIDNNGTQYAKRFMKR